jgi:hypothetical protein
MSWTSANSFGTPAAYPSRIRVLSEHCESTDPSQVVTSSPALRPHKSFSSNTYKRRGGVPLWLTRIPLISRFSHPLKGNEGLGLLNPSPAARRKRTTVRKSPSPALRCSQIFFQLSTVDLPTSHEYGSTLFLTSFLRYLLTSSFTNNCKLTTVNCFSSRPGGQTGDCRP